MSVTVVSHLCSWFLQLSNHGSNHVFANTRIHPTVFAKGLVLKCQNKHVQFLTVLSESVTRCISLPTTYIYIYTTMITEAEEESRRVFCWLLIACVTLTEHFLFYLFALRRFHFLSKLWIVSSIIHYFYWMCMFICQIVDIISKWFLSFYPYLFHSNKELWGISFNFELTVWNQTKETDELFCLSCWPSI